MRRGLPFSTTPPLPVCAYMRVRSVHLLMYAHKSVMRAKEDELLRV